MKNFKSRPLPNKLKATYNLFFAGASAILLFISPNEMNYFVYVPIASSLIMLAFMYSIFGTSDTLKKLSQKNKKISSTLEGYFLGLLFIFGPVAVIVSIGEGTSAKQLFSPINIAIMILSLIFILTSLWTRIKIERKLRNLNSEDIIEEAFKPFAVTYLGFLAGAILVSLVESNEISKTQSSPGALILAILIVIISFIAYYIISEIWIFILGKLRPKLEVYRKNLPKKHILTICAISILTGIISTIFLGKFFIFELTKQQIGYFILTTTYVFLAKDAWKGKFFDNKMKKKQVNKNLNKL